MTYYERHLPHWHPDGKAIFLTWRLFGSLPRSVLNRLERLRDDPEEQFLAAEGFLDVARTGPFWLCDPEIAEYAQYPILRGVELGHYKLFAYVVMPNHVHLLHEPLVPLARVTRGIKGVSARDANATLDRVGKPFWQHESFDHWIRNGAELERIVFYIENNPVKAGFVKQADDWPWSSASRDRSLVASAFSSSEKWFLSRTIRKEHSPE
jgi:putative transposase